MSYELDVLMAHLAALEIVLRSSEQAPGHSRVAVGWIDDCRHLARKIDSRAVPCSPDLEDMK